MRLAALALLAAAAFAAAQPGGAQAPQDVCGKLLAPARGAYFGAFTDFNTPREFSEDHVSVAKIDAFTRLAGRAPVWVYLAQHWHKGLQFPREKVLTIWRNGQIPYVVFQPDSGKIVAGDRPPGRHVGVRYCVFRSRNAASGATTLLLASSSAVTMSTCE